MWATRYHTNLGLKVSLLRLLLPQQPAPSCERHGSGLTIHCIALVYETMSLLLLPHASRVRPATLALLQGHALLESCCDVDSELSALAHGYGMRTCRVTQVDRFDWARGLRKARDFIGANRAVDAWGALPCTTWCSWQFVNEAKLGPASCLAWRGAAGRRSAWSAASSSASPMLCPLAAGLTLSGRDGVVDGNALELEQWSLL